MAVLGIACIVYFSFIAPSQIINKVHKKDLSDEHGISVWITSLWTAFIPMGVCIILGIRDKGLLLVVFIIWIVVVSIFLKGIKESSPKKPSNTVSIPPPFQSSNKPNYEWELTREGLKNLKNGVLIPREYLRQIDRPEPGCLIDNYILRTEFIPENKIRMNSSEQN